MGELTPEELKLVTKMQNSMTDEPITYRSSNSFLKPVNSVNDIYLKVPNVEGDTVSLQSRMSITERETINRETWGKKIDFLLSVIGFAVDLANVWRFPYLCFKNGGGVFLIPYTLMLLMAGIPLFYMELALGQYYRQGAITTWGRVCPLFKGIGFCVILIAFYTDFFYNVIIAWSLHFFFASFTSVLPWSHCNNSWNSPFCREPFAWIDGTANTSQCLPRINESLLENVTDVSSAHEYYYTQVLGLRDNNNTIHVSVNRPGQLKWQLALCLLAVYLICYFSLWKGIKMSGKVVWFTAVFPYVVLFALLIRGVTLPGAIDGIKYYLKPDLMRLKDGQVWLEAATQVFFSLGPGFGVLLAFASYNKFHNNVYHDALVTSTVNCCTSFLAGFVIFSVLGFMSCKSGKPIEKVADQGPGLVFVVYPEALATMPGSSFWSVLFFLMLLTLGLDSSFGGSEAIITGLSDEFPLIRKNREVFVACLFSFYMLIGFLMCSEAGLLFVEFMSHYAASWGLLIAVFFETMVISWIYGLRRFLSDIKEMLGFEPGFYWRFCWAFLGPAFLVYNVIYGFVTYKPVEVTGYEYPAWIEGAGWVIGFSSASFIPFVGLYKFLTAPGQTYEQKWKFVITPWKEKPESITAIRSNKVEVGVQDFPEHHENFSDPGEFDSKTSFGGN